MAVWRSGNVVGRINEVALRRARLAPGWVTFGRANYLGMQPATRVNSTSYLRGMEMNIGQSAAILCGCGVKAKRVQKFDAKFYACSNLLCKINVW